jgi:threonine/homoserine/homoserine lactone efflux protein
LAPPLLALLFGVSVGLSIGPVAILILTLAATEGFPAGLRAGLGAAAADFCYALLAFLGGSALSERAQALGPFIAAPAALLLLLLGLWLCRQALHRGGETLLPAVLARRPFVGVFALTLGNPLTVLLFVGFAPQLPLAASSAAAFTYALACGLGSGLVQTALAFGGERLRRRLTAGEHRRRLGTLSGALIALFGLVGLARAFS